jgi:(4-O-methyl)-D-glucuronate---lignin esterase
VFRAPATALTRALPRSTTTALATIEGPWSVTFPPNWGAPPQSKIDKLASWTAFADPGVKYFSGTATYTKELQAPPAWFKPGARVVLNLGSVREIAEVSLNGKPVGGVLWKPPFDADLTEALKPGANRLEIKVTNLWPNRMIGDLQPSATKRYAFTDYKPYTKDSPLIESGLLGPVRLLTVSRP